MDYKKVKITVHVPSSHTQNILDAINQAGAGTIGNYDYCSFITKGTGTFRPLEKANPKLGEKYEINFVEEDKIQFVCDYQSAKQVIEKIIEAHPYEEVAYDVVGILEV